MPSMFGEHFWKITILVVVLLLTYTAAQEEYTCPNDTEKCSAENCTLPDCRCWGYDTPGNLSTDDTPQIVLFTFMRGFNKAVYSNISTIFKNNRRNPNGARISATLYVTGEGTDYCAVRRLWESGHEIASHGLSYKAYQDLWRTANQSEWVIEMTGQRQNISQETGIDESEIRGMRAPYFQSGGDEMFTMLAEAGFRYDSSLQYYDSDSEGNHGWPLTLDYSPGYDESMSYPWNSKCFNGIWEVPVLAMKPNNNATVCRTIDTCELFEFLQLNRTPAVNDTLLLFQRNFYEYYNTNKAPVMFNINANWFSRSSVVAEAISEFLDEILAYDDVYVVNTWQAIQWIQDPTPLQNLTSFQPWARSKRPIKDCEFQKVDDIAYDVIQSDKSKFDSMLETIFTGNGLLALEFIILIVSAVLLIARDNSGD